MARNSLLKRVKRKIDRHLYAPKIAVESGPPLRFLGSAYGGWHLEERPSLRGSTVVSAGLGEDASFDAELARSFGAKLLIVDPTPRAIAHFDEMVERIGKPSEAGYAEGGKQPVEAYPLDNVTADQLELLPFALWTEKTTLKFYLPANPDHVSHSIVNFQNDYATDTAAIEVQSARLGDILAERNLSDLPLLKLDIEGAEIAVVQDMLEQGIYPEQLLIELDELINPSPRSRDNAETVDRRLREHGYICRYFDGISNLLYVRSN